MKCPACGSTNVVSSTCSDQPLAKDIQATGSIVIGLIFNGMKKAFIGQTVSSYKCLDCDLNAPKTEWEKEC